MPNYIFIRLGFHLLLANLGLVTPNNSELTGDSYPQVLVPAHGLGILYQLRCPHLFESNAALTMAVLIVLFGSLLLYRGLGAFGIAPLATWLDSARFALATMFAFTAVSHFAPMRKDLIAMVPPALPRPDLIILATGFLEIAGAIGLVIPATRLWAAWGLIALLIAMFPANIRAARQGVAIRGRPASPLGIRAPMQILFILWAWWVK